MTLESKNSTSKLIKDTELDPVDPEMKRLDEKGSSSTVQNEIVKETHVSLLFPMRPDITPNMIFVAVPLIGYYFGDGYRKREILRQVRKMPASLPSQKVTIGELSTTWKYLFIDSIIDLMSFEHLLYD